MVYISQHKQLRASAFVPLVEHLYILFLFWQLSHNAGVGPALTGRLHTVCCEDIRRLQERKLAKWKMIVLSTRGDAMQDSKEDEIGFISDSSVLKLYILLCSQILCVFHITDCWDK